MYTLAKKMLVCWLMVSTVTVAYGESGWRKLTLNFYGQLLQFNLSGDFYTQREYLLSDLSVEEKSTQLLNDSDLQLFAEQAQSFANQLKLDDVGYLFMVKKAARELNKDEDANVEQLFTYAVLSIKGYDVLLGVGNTGVTLYGNTDFSIKNILFVTQNNKKYYDLSFNQLKTPGEERSVARLFNQSAKSIRLNRLIPPSLPKKMVHKTIPFEYEGNVYFFTTTYNQHLVGYYKDLPDIELSKVYLNYGLSERGEHTLINQLKEATSYLSKEKTVDFLLAFVQSLSYAKDIDVIGHEKFSFPEESLANDFTDCEDRSMLFAYLVREVANLQSIGLMYPNASHMNVAVESWKKSNKSDIQVFEMDFVVCEPSGNGFKAGQYSSNLSAANVIKW
ncbi:MAG: hypothetical protein EAY81_07250 [Bacteroidetes bacterium]|nr:MAG: hypothetical protein EAY81_07250 [Bacteroidota bacterium]